MDDHREQLLAYARNGDISGLYLLMQQNPGYLESFDDNAQFVDTPLHTVAAAGFTTFAIEICILMPCFRRKLNARGLSPLHLALIENHDETARALVKLDNELVRVKGHHGMTPLHYAAKMNKTDLLAKFVFECPDSVDDLTNKFQTVAHVALENDSFEAFNLNFGWLTRRGRKDVLGMEDMKGNTVLHIAALKNNVEGVLKKSFKVVRINAKNYEDMTALDIAENNGSEEAVQVLQGAGAKKGRDIATFTLAEFLTSPQGFIERMFKFFILMKKDLSMDMRNVVLLVAALITTASFQAVLSPPGGVYQGEADSNTTNSTKLARAAGDIQNIFDQMLWMKHEKSLVGKMVMTKRAYNQFMPANTVVFVLSIAVIVLVLHARAYNLILHTCLVFLAYGYLVAMVYISNFTVVSTVLFYLSWIMLGIVYSLKVNYYILVMRGADDMIDRDNIFHLQEDLRILIRRMVMQYKVLTK